MISLLYAALVVLFVLVSRDILIYFEHPSAPGGPLLSRWTRLWYAYKVWQGSFETWNIRQHSIHGPILRVAPKWYSIDDPRAAKQIYGIGTPFVKSSWYSFAADPKVGPDDNVFSIRNPNWHAQVKRRMAGMFSMSTVKQYEPFVDECIVAFLQQWKQLAETGERIDLQTWAQAYAFDGIGMMTFGARQGFIDNGAKDTSLFESIYNMQTFTTMIGITYPWGLPFLLLKFGNPVRGLLDYVTILRRKAEETNPDLQSSPLETPKSNQPVTFLSKVVQDATLRPTDHEKLRVPTVLNINIAAGSDTTSIALTSILYNSSRQPRIYSTLRSELTAAIAAGRISATEPITYSQTQSLPYLQAVIKEALRFHPSTGLPMWRLVPKGGAEIAGTFFPEGTWVGINPWVAGRNTSIYGEDAGVFRPERYLPGKNESEGDFKMRLEKMESYNLTFGMGSRTCLGKWVSILEMSKLTAEIVRGFEVSIDGVNENGNGEVERTNNWFVKQKNAWARVEYKPLS